MATQKKSIPSTDTDTITVKPKTCFIMMPIADHPDYDKGHFNRVYQYLIKPACIKAGYNPIRADDNKASNMIMFDILKKIVECDMAICDLSSRNANVFYELGLRQAFNKKTILITDGLLPTPFDISAFRYVSYSPSLRVDTVDREIPGIVSMLQETENQPSDDVNSIIKLLQVKPSEVKSIDLNAEESIMYNMLTNIQKQIAEIKQEVYFDSNTRLKKIIKEDYYNGIKNNTQSLLDKYRGANFNFLFKAIPELAAKYDYLLGNEEIGMLYKVDNDTVTFNYKGHLSVFNKDDETLNRIVSI